MCIRDRPDTVLSKDIKVVADKSTTSLVVTARPDEFEALSNIVSKLDVVRKQVFIEALIMEVSSEASFSFGINWAVGGNTGDAAIVGGVSLNEMCIRDRRRTEESRNGSTPMSKRRVTAPGASLVCRVEKTRCPVSADCTCILYTSRVDADMA